ncbi:MAG: hypothetical protein Q8P41_02720 [Pseudomonadota bacterium]|nr:hypothetical protein [Pseudomonadota bacterium]
MILIFQAVLAADPSVYAVAAPVTIPAAGPVRVGLGPDLVGGEPDGLAETLLVTNAEGVPVPYAVLRSTQDGSPYESDLDFRPVGESAWETEGSDRPVDALELEILDLEGKGPFMATVRWGRNGAWSGAATELVYHLSDGAEARRVEVPHVSGPFRVELVGYDGEPPRLVDLTSIRELPGHVPRVVETVAMPSPVLTEDGRARYTLRLDGPRAVTELRFQVPPGVDIFERYVDVRVPSAWGEAGAYLGSASSGTIRRIRVGGAHVDRVSVPVGFSGDTLIVEIATDRGDPLPIDAVEVVSEGAQLLLRDAGPGPHTIYAAAATPSTPYDLGVAAPELLDADPPLVVAGSAARNPAWVPTPTREGVDDPGPDLSLARFQYERDIVGEPGWTSIPLDRSVLARTREDLADVRIVDTQGRQVPFLLWRTGDEVGWDAGPVEREEKGATTRLRVPLDGTAPVASIQLQTSERVFERGVSILRDTGRTTTVLRRVNWQGPERGGTLAIQLNERLGDALLIHIENGDNPPLAIDAVRVTSPGWELRARIPEGGARLVYGAPGARAPAYDLSLLEQDVRRMPVATATLGEERPLEAPTPGAVDRGLALVGIGVLAVGLIGMVVRVLTGVAAPSPDEAAG